jgi:hypothetical protein
MRDVTINFIHHDDLGDILRFFVINEFGNVLDVVVRSKLGNLSPRPRHWVSGDIYDGFRT